MYPELNEISFGEMEGLSDEEIALRFRDFQQEQAKMEYDIPYPGGESAGDVVRRVIPVFRQIRESGYEKVAVVTHGGVIRSMTAHFLGMDYGQMEDSWNQPGKLQHYGIELFPQAAALYSGTV